MWYGEDIRVGSLNFVHLCSHQLHGDPKLPAETEACASVTSAFLQVMRWTFLRSLKVMRAVNARTCLSSALTCLPCLQVMSILFEVESLRVREPRNILQVSHFS